jgi:hypothetical protein
MATTDAVIDWLLDSDPSIRWQAMRDLLDAPEAEWRAERAKVETEGWGARLLSYEHEDGQWAGGAFAPRGFARREFKAEGQPWTATASSLSQLHELGVSTTEAGTAIAPTARFARHSRAPSTCSKGCWSSNGPPAARPRPERRASRARSTSSSGASTVAAAPASRPTSASCPSAPEPLALSRSAALDYFRSSAALTGAAPDPRLGEAVEHVRSRRRKDGTWALDWTLPGRVWFEMDEGLGLPSRWMTLRALRVLRWWDGSATMG